MYRLLFSEPDRLWRHGLFCAVGFCSFHTKLYLHACMWFFVTCLLESNTPNLLSRFFSFFFLIELNLLCFHPFVSSICFLCSCRRVNSVVVFYFFNGIFNFWVLTHKHWHTVWVLTHKGCQKLWALTRINCKNLSFDTQRLPYKSTRCHTVDAISHSRLSLVLYLFLESYPRDKGMLFVTCTLNNLLSSKKKKHEKRFHYCTLIITAFLEMSAELGLLCARTELSGHFCIPSNMIWIMHHEWSAVWSHQCIVTEYTCTRSAFNAYMSLPAEMWKSC